MRFIRRATMSEIFIAVRPRQKYFRVRVAALVASRKSPSKTGVRQPDPSLSRAHLSLKDPRDSRARAISWKDAPDRRSARARIEPALGRLQPVAAVSGDRRLPGSSCYILITYLSEEGKTRAVVEDRRGGGKIEVDGPRDPFVCGNGLSA